MQQMPFHRLQLMLASIAVLVMMLLVTACAGVGGGSGSGTGQSPTVTTGTPTTSTQVHPTATQQPVTNQTPVAFKAGGISFIGPVKSITSNRLVMSAPNGQ